MSRLGRVLVPLAFALLAACSGGANGSGTTTVTAKDTASYAGIAPDEIVHFTGTEPFWSGEVSGETLTYVTPDYQAGAMVAVDRFAGRNGVSFSGDLDDLPFVLAVTPGQCRDGMSDRSYPFTVTLQVKGQQRNGCAWTDKQPFSGPQHP